MATSIPADIKAIIHGNIEERIKNFFPEEEKQEVLSEMITINVKKNKYGPGYAFSDQNLRSKARAASTWRVLDKDKKQIKANDNQLCFAQVPASIRYEDQEKLKYLRTPFLSAGLSKEEKLKWAELLVKFCRQDSGQSPEEIVERGILFDVDQDTPQQFFIASLFLRSSWEHPETAYWTLRLSDAGFGFWQAYYFSSICFKHLQQHALFYGPSTLSCLNVGATSFYPMQAILGHWFAFAPKDINQKTLRESFSNNYNYPSYPWRVNAGGREARYPVLYHKNNLITCNDLLAVLLPDFSPILEATYDYQEAHTLAKKLLKEGEFSNVFQVSSNP